MTKTVVEKDKQIKYCIVCVFGNYQMMMMKAEELVKKQSQGQI